MTDVLEGVLKEFAQIASIPRPSKREGAVADYLIGRLESLGAEVVTDKLGNLIAETAAPSQEGKPQFALQAHMDMVCVSDGTKPYNPLTDGIELVREGNYLKAAGTSLGADDGIGIAIILYILAHRDSESESTPLRIIFTVDEEAGMSGARGLNEEYLSDIKYLINVDSENVDELVTGSAGSLRIDFNRKMTRIAPTKSTGYKLKVSGLKGGHSGEAIGIPHANAIKVLAEAIKRLDCEVASVQGGRAMNVIPSEAEAVIVLNADQDTTPCRTLAEEVRSASDEGGIDISLVQMELPSQVYTTEDTNNLIRLIESLKDGLHDAETSANIGVLATSEEGVRLEYMPRFHSETGREVMQNSARTAAESSGFTATFGDTTPPWKSECNRLAECMKSIAHEQGRDLTERVIHGGLECSYFSVKNPSLEIVSIGTTNLDIHSPKERLVLSSVEPFVRLIQETLKRGVI